MIHTTLHPGAERYFSGIRIIIGGQYGFTFPALVRTTERDYVLPNTHVLSSL